MTKKKWIKNQFEIFKKYKQQGRYRDVLVITSFIETAIREEAAKTCKKAEHFKKSLEALGIDIDKQNEKKSTYKQNCQYKKDCLKKINVLRVQRNELLHDILRRRLPRKYIENTIKRMAKSIEHICTKSGMVRDYFVRYYRFDPAETI